MSPCRSCSAVIQGARSACVPTAGSVDQGCCVAKELHRRSHAVGAGGLPVCLCFSGTIQSHPAFAARDASTVRADDDDNWINYQSANERGSSGNK